MEILSSMDMVFFYVLCSGRLLTCDNEVLIFNHHFLFSVDVELEFEMFRSLDAFIGPQLSAIASTISEQCTLHALQTAQLAASEHKFVYFNRLNLAFKTSVSNFVFKYQK